MVPSSFWSETWAIQSRIGNFTKLNAEAALAKSCARLALAESRLRLTAWPI
jgi:hypothetical protein